MKEEEPPEELRGAGFHVIPVRRVPPSPASRHLMELRGHRNGWRLWDLVRGIGNTWPFVRPGNDREWRRHR